MPLVHERWESTGHRRGCSGASGKSGTHLRRPPGVPPLPRLLLVDDEPAILRSYALLLQSRPSLAGVEVATARTPAEAATALRAGGLALVLSDHDLRSAWTGVDVLREAAHLDPQARRVLVSGHEPATMERLVDGRIVQAFVPKTHPAEFLDRVERELRASPLWTGA